MNNIIQVYFIIAGIQAFCTAAYLLDEPIDGIDNFWDWVWYNILWIIPSLKSAFKIITQK